jgi:tetratricopeptide (TPR) repeat protein
MAEVGRELQLNPLNLPMVREELWILLDSTEAVDRAIDSLVDYDADGLRLLRADLFLQRGRLQEALEAVEPLFGEPRQLEALLKFATSLARELTLQNDRAHQRATAAWLVDVFGEIVAGQLVPRNQQSRVADLLAAVCEDVLELGLLDEDPERAIERLEAALDQVRQFSPGSTRLYAARIKLAVHTRDVLGRPRDAARSLERLLVDLDLPLEGVALARLALGECHLVAGDTARARTVLDRLGGTAQFAEAAGHAHYLLGRLDFAQGDWANARDRLAAVALDNAGADYANDALDLGLLIAEELTNPTGSPQRLASYAPCVYWDLVRRPDRRQAALEGFLAAAGTPSPDGDDLLDRVRLELASLYAGAGRAEQAANLCAAVVDEHPDGARAAAALYRRGEILVRAGRVRDGREAWERLLVQYPDALESEDARAKLRSLP